MRKEIGSSLRWYVFVGRLARIVGGANTDATKERNADHLRRRQTMLLPAEVTVQVAGDKGGTEHVLHTGEKAVGGAINE